MRIIITPAVSIDDRELHVLYIQSGGPGGQNVNKVATAAQLQFDLANSPSLPIEIKYRLAHLAGSKLSNDGVITITARRFRSQDQNRQDATERLVAMILEASHRPKTRRPTRPSKAQRRERLEGKTRRGATKRSRSPVGVDE
jgi:ribosome-associated protein